VTRASASANASRVEDYITGGKHEQSPMVMDKDITKHGEGWPNNAVSLLLKISFEMQFGQFPLNNVESKKTLHNYTKDTTSLFVGIIGL
jgi:hypothetical protein